MPIIAISRGTFSGGRTIAECLAERLGYPCVSREVIFDAAEKYGVPTAKLTEAMGKPPSFWQQLTSERSSYVSYFRAALCERARQSELVYHGFAGHILLKGITHVIRVRVIADSEYRISAAMREMKFERSEAIAYINKVDHERASWNQFMYGVNWYDPSLYDLVLNLEHITPAGACEVLVQMAQLPEFQPTPASRRAMEDLALRSQVEAALAKDARTRTSELRVCAHDGIVTVTGTTRLESVTKAVPAVAAQVEGVREVRSEVVVGSVLARG
ncbi:MAG: cytidylate kinase family protein [Chloroflexi bacterium]|nr:cytidylate kinase family protein [Chloroflexota bacterium]